VNTLGHLFAMTVTPAKYQDCTQVDARRLKVRQVTGAQMTLSYVEQG
jgi:hypothetical protein